MASNAQNHTASATADDAEMADNADSSCQGCRRRKLRCSRERPRCAHCTRISVSCVYGQKKKPGLKPGAMEGVYRRLEALEYAVTDMSGLRQPQAIGGDGNSGSSGVGNLDLTMILSRLADGLNSFNAAKTPASSTAVNHSNPTATSPTNSALSRRSDNWDASSYNPAAMRKRRRLNSGCEPRMADPPIPLCDLDGAALPHLPEPGILQFTIDAYFDAVQPWVPILHEARFRKRMADPAQSESLTVVLHAMVVAALRFVNPERTNGGSNESQTDLDDGEGNNDDNDRQDGWDGLPCDRPKHGDRRLPSPDMVEKQVIRSRRFVILTAMDHLSVESLQALSIVAFTDIGNGDASKAWSIVGSLTRTVEYLRLSVESDMKENDLLLRPLTSLPEPSDWTEEEERRRVFWNIFNLDRFCSVITGWNTSLTADDVHRRLPADGGMWHSEEFVRTPYFGIWDRSTAKMGNSIMFLPAHFTNPNQTSDQQTDVPVDETRPDRQAGYEQGTTVGAYAYCVEATESLSRVTTFFLRQKINFQDRQEVTSWLTRFKELDLRLVHWKLFLPPKWKDSNISRKPGVIDMDPNLTLAHITHNSSTILLHHRIAYPESHWAKIVRLPSAASSETCQIAACETATIAEKYLKHTPTYCPSTSQFAFCLFVSARVLLVHAKYYNTDLNQEFWDLTHSLDDLARRWAGPIFQHKSDRSLAGKYAKQLRSLQRQFENDSVFEVDMLSSLAGIEGAGPATAAAAPQVAMPAQQVGTLAETPGRRVPTALGIDPGRNKGSESLGSGRPFPDAQPLDGFPGEQRDELGAGLVGDPATFSEYAPCQLDIQDNLSAISQILTDDDFLSMDRVISFHNSMFSPLSVNGRPVINNWNPLQNDP